jgi:N-acetyl-anhydromuramyl-L-alanine amidase AmpD
MIPISDLSPVPVDRTMPSPNASARPADVAIRCVVLHATAGTDLGAERWMLDPVSRVSAHLHIRRDGSVTRLVADHRAAWHAGASEWQGRTRVNDFSLGWEIGNANNGREPYTDAQYDVLALLAAHYVRQGLTLEEFVSHEEIARPRGRKNDPLGFDWPRFRAETRAQLQPPPSPPAPALGEPVYSRWARDYLVPVWVESDRVWEYVTQAQILALPRTRASTPLSQMPRRP